MYLKANYRKVKDRIEQRRADARATAEERNARLREQYADIRQIDEELTKTGLLLFRAAARRESVEPIRERNRELNERRQALLLSYGYPSDYTEVHYTCPLCSDTGFAGVRMCSCLREELILENIRSSGIGDLIERQTFDNFSVLHLTGEVRSRMERVREQLRHAAESFDGRMQNFLLMGTTGVGKTHLSTAFAYTVLRRGFGVLYDTAQNVLAAFEADRFRRSVYDTDEPAADKYLSCDLLILDDLGTEFRTSFSISALYNLINTRQNRGLSTIISTNLNYESLTQQYEDRIYSRLIGSDYKILFFEGEDYRLKR